MFKQVIQYKIAQRLKDGFFWGNQNSVRVIDEDFQHLAGAISMRDQGYDAAYLHNLILDHIIPVWFLMWFWCFISVYTRREIHQRIRHAITADEFSREWPIFRWMRSLMCHYTIWKYRTNQHDPRTPSSTGGRREAWQLWGDLEWDGTEIAIGSMFDQYPLEPLDLKPHQDDDLSPMIIINSRSNDLTPGLNLPQQVTHHIAQFAEGL